MSQPRRLAMMLVAVMCLMGIGVLAVSVFPAIVAAQPGGNSGGGNNGNGNGNYGNNGGNNNGNGGNNNGNKRQRWRSQRQQRQRQLWLALSPSQLRHDRNSDTDHD